MHGKKTLKSISTASPARQLRSLGRLLRSGGGIEYEIDGILRVGGLQQVVPWNVTVLQAPVQVEHVGSRLDLVHHQRAYELLRPVCWQGFQR